MFKKILLTSFTIWKAHHTSNSSDDLLEMLSQTHPYPLHYLRKLPVDFQLAPRQVLDRFRELLPEVTILCGMAEDRSELHVESQAVVGEEVIINDLDLQALTAGLAITEISYDAGRFVCNELYYRMLKHHRDEGLVQPCVFVHIPRLTEENRQPIMEDFQTLIQRLSALPLPAISKQSARLGVSAEGR